MPLGSRRGTPQGVLWGAEVRLRVCSGVCSGVCVCQGSGAVPEVACSITSRNQGSQLESLGVAAVTGVQDGDVSRRAARQSM